MTVQQEARPRDDVRRRIVDAAAALLRDQGAAAVTTRAVATAAGVQPPTIYRLFGDKDGLVDALAEHVMATYVATKASAAQAEADAPAGDPVADLRAGWRLHVEFGLANPELYALLAAPRPGATPSPATTAGIDVLRTRVRRLAAAGLLQVDEERALHMIHAAGNGTVLALLGQPAAERDPGLADAMLDAVLTGVLASTATGPAGPAASHAGPRTAAVTLVAVLDELPGLSDAERALLTEWLGRSLTLLRTPPA